MCQSIVFLFRLAPVSICIHLPALPVALCTNCSFKRQNAQPVVSPVKSRRQREAERKANSFVTGRENCGIWSAQRGVLGNKLSTSGLSLL